MMASHVIPVVACGDVEGDRSVPGDTGLLDVFLNLRPPLAFYLFGFFFGGGFSRLVNAMTFALELSMIVGGVVGLVD